MWPVVSLLARNKLRSRPDVNVYKFPPSHRRQQGATVILSSRVDPVDLHGARIWEQLRQPKVSRKTVCSALETSGSFFGAKFDGTFATRK